MMIWLSILASVVVGIALTAFAVVFTRGLWLWAKHRLRDFEDEFKR